MERDPKTPGQLLTDLLAERDWSKRVLAVVLEVDETAINRLAADKRRFTAELAVMLEEIFTVPADRFLDLQKSYDLAKARFTTRSDPSRSTRAALFKALPISTMIKRGWINAANVKDSDKVEEGLSKFFGVNSVEEIEILPHAAKKTVVSAGTTAPQLAWLYRVKQIAGEMIAPAYSSGNKGQILKAMRPLLISVEAARKVPRILAEAGIRFVIVESLPSAKIDGVCMWLDEKAPVIAMTLRYDRIDNFWFVLRHELEHVFCEHGKNSINLDSELEGDNAGTGADLPEEERIANGAAADFMVPAKVMDAYLARKAPFFTERDMVGLARTIGVHPGIVAGQIQHHTGRYELFREYLQKIRSVITPGAIVDGWGDIAPISL